MAHIVCVTLGYTGMLNTTLALAKQLEQAGHRITYASPDDLKERLIAQGFAYVQIERDLPAARLPLSWWEKLRTVQSRQQQAVKALGVENGSQNFGQKMRSLSPDLLLIHNEMHAHIMAAVAAQIPTALLCSFLSVWRRSNLPPIHSRVVPGEGWRGQWLGIQWTWLRYSWRKWKEYQRDRWQQAGVDRISILRCYAQQIGHPFPSRFGFTQWLVPYPHDQLPVLCMNALEMDFPHVPHPSMHYIGPTIREDRPEPQVAGSTYEALEQIFKKRRSSPERCLIYCGCSTFVKGSQQRLQKIIEAVSTRPHWDLVVGLGGQLSPEQLGASLPQNVHAFTWAPALQILQQADCAVMDAGINAIRECVQAGVPMLLYSRGHDDQNGNQARAVYHRLALTGDQSKDDAIKVRSHIQTLLTDTAYQNEVRNMRDRCRRYSDEKRAAQIVEALLKSTYQEAVL